MNVERVFSRNLVRIRPSATIEDAARLMKERHVGALLVMEEGPAQDAVGIVTDRDLVVRALAEGAYDRTVGEIMSRALATVPRSADVFEALERMRGNGMRRLAVTEDGGAVVGIVSADDIVGAIAAELTSLNGILESELRHEAAREGESGEISA